MSASRQQIINFLRALDAQLGSADEIFIIGGGAITLAYNDLNTTVDIDVVEVSSEILQLGQPGSDLQKQFNMYIEKVSEIGFTAPKDWRKNAVKINDLDLKRLSVYVADPYDIILGKLARCSLQDIGDIAGLVKRGFVNLKTLVDRLNGNIKELKYQDGYLENTKRLIRTIFKKELIIQDGKVQIIE